MKTMYESFLELEDTIYRDKYLDLLEKLSENGILIDTQKIKNLSYKEKYYYLLNTKNKTNIYKKITNDYIQKIRNL